MRGEQPGQEQAMGESVQGGGAEKGKEGRATSRDCLRQVGGGEMKS